MFLLLIDVFFLFVSALESEVLSIIRYRGTSKIAGQLSSRCPYALLLIELPTPVVSVLNQLHPISIYIVYISVLLVVFHMMNEG